MLEMSARWRDAPGDFVATRLFDIPYGYNIGLASSESGNQMSTVTVLIAALTFDSMSGGMLSSL